MKESDLKLIEDYLHGELSQEVSLEVEERYNSDKRFKELVDLSAEINCAVLEKDIMNFRNQLKKGYKIYKFNKKIKKWGLIIIGIWLIWIGLTSFGVIGENMVRYIISFVLFCLVSAFFIYWNIIRKL